MKNLRKLADPVPFPQYGQLLPQSGPISVLEPILSRWQISCGSTGLDRPLGEGRFGQVVGGTSTRPRHAALGLPVVVSGDWQVGSRR